LDTVLFPGNVAAATHAIAGRWGNPSSWRRLRLERRESSQSSLLQAYAVQWTSISILVVVGSYVVQYKFI
jgi:hypothetical protein